MYWKKAATCVAAVVTGLVLVTTPAAAATYPTSKFGPAYKGPSYGATWSKGTITWYDRGVGIKGELRTVSSGGCRTVVVYTEDAKGAVIKDGQRSSSLKCGDAVHPIDFKVPADVAGGAAFVAVCLDDADPSSHLTCSDRYPRP